VRRSTPTVPIRYWRIPMAMASAMVRKLIPMVPTRCQMIPMGMASLTAPS
tara:strand:+ start:83072 stop:83221 length:150 start_codon:yes stop_codon:yes gene_type:complete